MNKIIVTIEDIKQLDKSMLELDTLKEKSYTLDGYGFNFKNKEVIIESKEKSIRNNISIYCHLLNVCPDTIISMTMDLDFAKEILNS